MDYIKEPEKMLPVRYEADVFVAGGSCTGLFAAVRAARLGARVVLVERQNMLGGTATSGLVNVWHSLKDTDYKEQVIAGLTAEMTERLVKCGAAYVKDDPSVGICFDPNRLAFELDCLAAENRITVLFHTLCTGVLTDEDNRICAAIIENKDGRSAVKAGFFIDATGDGDLAKYLKLPFYRNDYIQPPTPCFFLHGRTGNVDIGRLIKEHGSEFGLPDDFGWGGGIPGVPDTELRADFHIFGKQGDAAEELSYIEAEGRRKAYALVELLRKYTEVPASVCALSQSAGIRESVHFETEKQASGRELLHGERYADAVLNGTYRVDVHDQDGAVTFKYLNGDAVRIFGAAHEQTHWNWRDRERLTGEPAKFYQAPFEILVQRKYANFIAVGRMLHADREAFGALRVMVNLNQLGEAAGTAAYLCLDGNTPVSSLDGKRVRACLKKGGSAL